MGTAPLHQEEKLVTKQFEDQLELYTSESTPEKSVVPFLVTPFFFRWLEREHEALQKQYPLTICEFGGGGGYQLKMIGDVAGQRATLYNAELVGRYAGHQASETVRFVQGSILASGFADSAFDVVIARNVLHHLIGASLAQTRHNQQHALEELFRVTRPGGLILIQEQVNQSPMACNALYHLSQTASNMDLRIESFEVTPNTIVAYMTRAQLQAFCRQVIPESHWLADQYQRRDVALRWKLTLLMSNNGDALIAMKKPLADCGGDHD
ncbi:MAG: class I SAM-dependent methyltransferase [Chloroflexota bacterium]|nr:class I SAM-dependent methyltransferase [Chloroflexota bacterium]